MRVGRHRPGPGDTVDGASYRDHAVGVYAHHGLSGIHRPIHRQGRIFMRPVLGVGGHEDQVVDHERIGVGAPDLAVVVVWHGDPDHLIPFGGQEGSVAVQEVGVSRILTRLVLSYQHGARIHELGKHVHVSGALSRQRFEPDHLLASEIVSEDLLHLGGKMRQVHQEMDRTSHTGPPAVAGEVTPLVVEIGSKVVQVEKLGEFVGNRIVVDALEIVAKVHCSQLARPVRHPEGPRIHGPDRIEHLVVVLGKR